MSVTEKRCAKCGDVKSESEFRHDRTTSTGLVSWCKACEKKRKEDRSQRGLCERCGKNPPATNGKWCVACHNWNTGWRDMHRNQGLCACGRPRAKGKQCCDICLSIKRGELQELRAEVIAAYGGQCAECGSTKNLEIHHIHGDGKAHRASLHTVGQRHQNAIHYTYRDLRDRGFPPNVVVLLCHDHHVAADRELRKAAAMV